MWSRLTVVVRHAPHWHVRLRLLVLLRPTWRSQTWSCRVGCQRGISSYICIPASALSLFSTHIECFGIVASLAAALPLTRQVVDGRGRSRLRCLDRRRRGGLGCLLRRGLYGLCDCLDTVHLKSQAEVRSRRWGSLPSRSLPRGL